jgi:hypothetical protein
VPKQPESRAALSHEIDGPCESIAFAAGMEYPMKSPVTVTGNEVAIIDLSQPRKHDVAQRWGDSLQVVDIAVADERAGRVLGDPLDTTFRITSSDDVAEAHVAIYTQPGCGGLHLIER